MDKPFFKPEEIRLLLAQHVHCHADIWAYEESALTDALNAKIDALLAKGSVVSMSEGKRMVALYRERCERLGNALDVAQLVEKTHYIPEIERLKKDLGFANGRIVDLEKQLEDYEKDRRGWP